MKKSVSKINNVLHSLLFMCLMLFAGITVEGQNNLSINNTTALPDDVVLIEVELTNADPVVAFQMDVPVPEGFQYVPESVSLSGRASEDHEIDASVVDNNLRILSWSSPVIAYEGNSGVVATFELETPVVDHETYTLNIVDAILSDEDGIDILDGVTPGEVEVLAQYDLTINVDGNGTTDPEVGTYTYDYGTEVSLTATASDGWTFSEWVGNVDHNESAATTITVSANETVTAVFSEDQYTLTINVEGEGSVGIDPDNAFYVYNDVVDLSAEPTIGWSFSHWAGNVDDTGSASTSITMQDNETVTAYFTEDEYELSITTSGVGDGSVTKSPDQPTYNYGTVVTVEATPDVGSYFNRWTGDYEGFDNPVEITMNDDRQLDAEFRLLYPDDITVDGSSQVLIPAAGEQDNTYEYTATVLDQFDDEMEDEDVTWSLDGASGGVSIDPNSGVLSVSSDAFEETITVIATSVTDADLEGSMLVELVFDLTEYTLTLIFDGDGTVNIDGQNYTSDQNIQLDRGVTFDIVATADTGWEFDSWTGDVADPNVSSTTIEMNDNKEATVHFTQIPYELTVNTDGQGTAVADPAEGPYYYGDVVDLNATADQGWSFDNWSGDPVADVNIASTTITITGNMSVTANFTQDEYTLTTDVEGAGSVNTDPDQATYLYNDEVTITAVADPGWTFSHWTGDVDQGEEELEEVLIIMTENKEVTAHFTEDEYDLTIIIDPAASGNVDVSPEGPYNYGDEVLLSAGPETGYSFHSWTGDVNDNESSNTFIIMTEDKTVTANFTINTHTLTVVANPAEGGDVTGGGDYDYGTSITITATANEGYTFENWTLGGDVVSTEPEFDYEMPDNDVTLTANFTINTHTLTLVADPAEGGDVTGGGDYDYGTMIAVTATANEGYTFENWTLGGDVVSTEPEFDYEMPDNDVTLTANFTINTHTLTLVADPTEGGEVTGGGDYDYGTSIPVTATANEGYTFENWTSGSTVISDVPEFNYVMPAQDVTLTANFIKLIPEYITVSGPNNVEIPAPGEDDKTAQYSANVYDQFDDVMENEEVTWSLSGQVPAGVSINETTGLLSVSSDAVERTIGVVATSVTDPEINRTHTIDLVYELDEFTLNLSFEGSGSVNIDGEAYTDDANIQLSRDETFDIVATADVGWEFSHWVGDVANTDANSTTIEMDDHKSVTVHFTQIPYQLTVNTVGEGSVEVEPDQAEYFYGEEVTLTAIATAGWTFNGWTGDVETGDEELAEVIITITDDKTVTAHFTKDEYTLTVHIDGEGSVAIEPEEDHYYYDDEVMLTAAEEEGWTFSHWSGDVEENGQDLEEILITMTDNKEVTAHFTQDEYSLTVYIEGEGAIDVDPEQDTYHYNEEITLTAIADEHHLFSHWSGDVPEGDEDLEEINIVMTEDKDVTAHFVEEKFILTVDIEGGGEVNINPDYEEYSYNTLVTLSAVPSENWEFSHWTGDVPEGEEENGEITFRMTEDKNITAHFNAIPYYLTIHTEGEGTVVADPDQEEYFYGDEVTLTAIPDDGWEFNHWEGDIEAGDENLEEIVVTINSDKEITAHFNMIPYELTIQTEGEGAVNADPDQEEYFYGDSVALTAVPDEGWIFSHWTGDVDDTESAETTITMTEDKVVTAYFEEIQVSKHTLSLIVNPEESGTVEGEGEYEEGENIAVSTIALEGWKFVNWTNEQDNVISTSADFDFEMPDEDVTLTANFEVDDTSIDAHDGFELTVYPNPVRNKLVVESDRNIGQVRIIDISGQVVIDKAVDALSVDIFVNNLQTGIYFLQVQGEGTISTTRIQVVR